MTTTEPADPTTDRVGPYTPEEFLAFIGTVWNFAPDPDTEDLTRFNELLHAALMFVGRLALGHARGDVFGQAAALLRSMEQRALWGPDHPVRQP